MTLRPSRDCIPLRGLRSVDIPVDVVDAAVVADVDGARTFVVALRRRRDASCGLRRLRGPDGTVELFAAGQADVAALRDVTAADSFGIGSITKLFVAVVVLQMAEEGLLSLDDPLSKVLLALGSRTDDIDGRLAEILRRLEGLEGSAPERRAAGGR